MPASDRDRVAGFVWCAASDSGRPPSAWREYFSRQTLPEVEEDGDAEAFGLLAVGLPDALPAHLPRTLLEEMAWALIARTTCEAVVRPLHVSLDPDHPPALGPGTPEAIRPILESGFVAMCRPGAGEMLARCAGDVR